MSIISGEYARSLKVTLSCTAITLLLQGWITGFSSAAEFNLGDARIRASGTLTYGTAIRTSGRDPDLIPAPSATAIGTTGRAPGGQNADDGNLNFDKGDRVSTVLKAVGGIDIQYGDFAARLSAKAWHDFTLADENVAWGNLPNAYTPNTPLGDSGFHRLARFSGAALMDAYVEGNLKLGGNPLLLRFGRQTIPWGIPTTIRGGLEQINAHDLPAIMRPGMVADETAIPVLSAFSRLTLGKQFNIEGFYQFQFEPNQIPGCGTFGSLVDYAAEGCDKVVVGPGNDRQSLAAGLFSRRAPDSKPSGSGQFGLGFTYLAEGVGKFGAYFARVHSRRWVPSALKSARVGLPPLIPGDPGAANVQYFIEYPEDVRIFGLNFQTRLPDGTAIVAELTHQPNQALRLNGTDMLNAFASNVAPTQLRADATATAPGAAYHGYDRRKITQLNIGASKPFRSLPGAAELTLSAEAALKYVHDLPNPALRRYGRADAFGLGPVNGACAGGAIQCSSDGFVTARSWGYRVRAALFLPQVATGLSLTPSLVFAHDVKGWSHDEMFSEKRKVIVAALRADYQKRYFAELTWTSIWGGPYDTTRDRDTFVAYAGMKF